MEPAARETRPELTFDRMAGAIPPYACRLLLMPCGTGALARLLRDDGREVHGLHLPSEESPASPPGYDSVPPGHLAGETLPFEEETFDCIIAALCEKDRYEVPAILRNAGRLLRPEGALLIACTDPAVPGRVAAGARQAGLELYLEPQAEGISILHLVKLTYDPLAHARALFATGQPGFSYHVLRQIPPVYLQDPKVKALVASEMALCLLEWERLAQDGRGLDRFHLTQMLFFEATWRIVHLHQAYHAYAEFWHFLGDDDMAGRVLRSILYAAPHPVTEKQLELYATGPPARRDETPPEWNPGDRTPRILMLTDDRPNYGLDILYEGLGEVIGPENIVEYPWKTTLHGGAAQRFGNYPCLFGLPGDPMDFGAVVDALGAGQFNLVLFGTIEQQIPIHEARAIAQAIGDCPLFILDQLDDPKDNRPATLEYLGLTSAAGYFKREMIACYDYGERTYPMPFAYSERYIPETRAEGRSRPLFWAGHRQFGLRRLYLEHIEEAFGLDLNERFDQAGYAAALQKARIGLDIFGYGFDTVRYWEVPAHRCMLLAERRPIVTPYDFRDGETAAIYTDLADLEAKLRYYMERPEEAEAIAQAGFEHLLRFHSSSARARHLLGWVDQAVGL